MATQQLCQMTSSCVADWGVSPPALPPPAGFFVCALMIFLYVSGHCLLLSDAQNADDNEYAATACPMLDLVLTPGSVSVLNNELGFKVKDVKGIADIGSSKKKGKAGYTGAVPCMMVQLVTPPENTG